MINQTLRQAIDEKNNDYVLPSGLLDPNARPPSINDKNIPTVSVVIPSYNSRGSILACLASIEQSSYNLKHQNRLQVVIVDDGSEDGTWPLLKKTGLALNLILVRQNNSGQARALNTGISVSEGDIVISCDSDMVLGYYAIEYFAAAYRLVPNALFAGFRQDIAADDARVNKTVIRKNGSHHESFLANDERVHFPVPGWPDNMCLTSNHFKKLGNGRRLWMPDNDAWLLPDMVIGALFSLSRTVYKEVGGYDERLVGWGCTDGYLAAKAIGAGQYIIPLYAASGLHMHHPIRLNNRQKQYESNRKLFFKFIAKTKINRHPNWLARAKDRIIESVVLVPKKNLSQTEIKSFQGDKTAILLNKIDNWLAVGQYDPVVKTIADLPGKNISPELVLRYGRAFLGMKRFSNAIKILREIPPTPPAALNLLLAQAASGRFKSAGKTLKQLAMDYPETPELKYWYKTSAENHISQGKKLLEEEFGQAARRCFEAVLIIDNNNRSALKYRNQCLKKTKL